MGHVGLNHHITNEEQKKRRNKYKNSESLGHKQPENKDSSEKYLHHSLDKLYKTTSRSRKNKKSMKTSGSSFYSVTCLGCMRLLSAKTSSKLVSCPVCRVVTPL